MKFGAHAANDGSLNSGPDLNDNAAVENLSTFGPDELINCMRALVSEKLSLQALVCELLCKNEQLRRNLNIDELPC
jgi:hypothetical protein